MGLLNHFAPPLSLQRHWHGFHNAWATYLAADLNRHLPPGYFAEPNVQFGIEIDVATFEESVPPSSPPSNFGQEPGSVSSAMWSPPAPVQTIPFTLDTDVVEVRVLHGESGPTLAGAIELISPANKDRSAHRETFVAKCATYLHRGLGVVLVDVVTSRRANLHNELMKRIAPSQEPEWVSDLYAVAYRVVERRTEPTLDMWRDSLSVGAPLPTLPLWLPGGMCIPVDLETTYHRTCREQRIPVPETEGNG